MRGSEWEAMAFPVEHLNSLSVIGFGWMDQQECGLHPLVACHGYHGPPFSLIHDMRTSVIFLPFALII
jgi:hypothetical protein